MSRTAQLMRLERLNYDKQWWDFDREKQTYTANVGPYRMEVSHVQHDGTMQSTMERESMNALWSVKHEHGGTLIEPTPSPVVLYAMRDAVDYVRAHILQEPELISA